MKKINKITLKVLSIITVISLPFYMLPISHSAQEIDNNKNEIHFYNQNEGTKQNNNILNYFQDSIVKSRVAYDTNNIELSYPEYYGGSYLNDDGKLVILLKNNDISIQRTLKSVSNNNNLIFESANYSYAELTQYILDILKYQESKLSTQNSVKTYDIAEDIIDCTLDDKNNKIIVGIRNLNDNKIKLFKKNVIDSDAIEFTNKLYKNSYVSNKNSLLINPITETNISTLSTNYGVRPGMSIIASNTSIYSVGFPVRRGDPVNGYQYGFLTAGHFMEEGYSIITTNYGEVVGTVESVAFGGKYDVSFVELNDGYTCSNNIYQTPYSLVTSNLDIDHPVVGKVVYKYGCKGYTSGTILSTNYAFQGIVSHYGLVKSSYASQEGDSGGLIASSSPDSPYTKIQEGIHAGNVLDNNGNVEASYYCSASNIVNLWYLVCY